MTLGVVGVVIYLLMTLTIWHLFFESYAAKNDLMKLVKPLEIFSVVLVTLGILNRKTNATKHREYIMFGSFCLIGPALDRTAFHLFGPEKMMWPSLILYLGLLGSFLWFTKQFKWYMSLWVVFLAFSLYPLFAT